MRRSYHHPATLGDMANQGLDIWCWCNGCCHHAVLTTDMLIARLGRDQGVPGVADHAYCGKLRLAGRGDATELAYCGCGDAAFSERTREATIMIGLRSAP